MTPFNLNPDANSNPDTNTSQYIPPDSPLNGATVSTGPTAYPFQSTPPPQPPSPTSIHSPPVPPAPPRPPQDHPVVGKPYHTKRPHKKSRTGCRNCKTRKVKCDEARPSCRSCRFRKAECIYPTPPPSPEENGTVVIRSRSPLRANTQDLVVFHDLGHHPMGIKVDEMDMKLLWWYTTQTYTSFSVDGGRSTRMENTLKVEVVQLAFQNPFLMNSLLGMTSLHLQQCGDGEDSTARVERQREMEVSNTISPSLRTISYHVKAFEGFRQAVSKADPDTFPALLACSLLICGLSSQAFRDPDTPPLYILDWMTVWRGIGVIVDMTKPKVLLESGLKHLFFRPKINLEEMHTHIPNTLLFMVSQIAPSDPEYPFVGTYHDALKYLGSLYAELKTGGFSPILDLRVITWFTFLPQGFVDLARAKRKRALVILAFYLMFLGLVESVWWVGGIAEGQVGDVIAEVEGGGTGRGRSPGSSPAGNSPGSGAGDSPMSGGSGSGGSSGGSGSGTAAAPGGIFSPQLRIPTLFLQAATQLSRARAILEDDTWTPPRGKSYNPADTRFMELGWVDDRGREVILETGEVVQPPPHSPTTMGTRVAGEGQTGEKEMAVWQCSTNEDRVVVMDTSADDIGPPIPFYAMQPRREGGIS